MAEQSEISINPLLTAEQIFDSMQLKSEESVRTLKEHMLNDGTVITASKPKHELNEITFNVKKGQGDYLGFTVDSSGLKELRIKSLHTTIAGVTLSRHEVYLSPENTKRKSTKLSSIGLVGWLSEMVLQDRFLSPRFNTEVELE